MPTQINQFRPSREIKSQIRPGDTVKVHQIISDLGDEKEKTQIFEGVVLAHKHGKEAGATITVRSVIDGIGVEKILPIHSPLIKQIEIVKRGKVRRAKLYYLRTAQGKRAKLKTEAAEEKVFEEQMPAPADKKTPEKPERDGGAIAEEEKEETKAGQESPEKEAAAEEKKETQIENAPAEEK